MKVNRNGHILDFKFEDVEIEAPDRRFWRFKEEMKKQIPPSARDYDPEDKRWYIDSEYIDDLVELMEKYFGG